MAYETKVILRAIAELALKSDSLEEFYALLQSIAEGENVILKPYPGKNDKEKE